MVLLKSQDDQIFEVSVQIASVSQLLKNMIQDLPESLEPIPLPNVTGEILRLVLEYCQHHQNDTFDESPDPVCFRVS